jgi:hypothetical protein
MDTTLQVKLINKLNKSIQNNDSITIQNKLEKKLILITHKLTTSK